METDQPVDNYWLRFRTIKDDKDGVIREGVAIIRYEGAPEQEPTTNIQQCTSDSPCTIFNCPVTGYANSEYVNCLTFNDAQSLMSKESLEKRFGVSDTEYEQYFYHFFRSGHGISGKKFSEPHVPLYQDHDDAIVNCDDVECNARCHCTHMQDLPFNKTIQMVWYNLGVDSYTGHFSHHPLHIHGHGFAVLKMGFPTFDPTTGLPTDQNRDITCDNQE